ncbi:MAG: histidinol-phosphatase [Clostridia bacterium]|nr:histidinol-phosphatase [Clostridia bacterium]
MIPSNYHTHTSYCHGADEPETLIREAMRLGCPEIGFSSHSFTSFDDSYCMSREVTEQYRARINELKQKYAGKIKILLGIEQDFYSDDAAEGYDFVIGSIHYVKKDGEYLSLDESREKQIEFAQKYYGGDIYALVEHYFETVAEVYDKTHCDIIGHFDLITKFNEDGSLFDTASPRYRAAALAALDKLCASPAKFEINTGAIARGYRTTPYPDDFIIAELKARDKEIIFSSDCHCVDQLLFGYDLYLQAINK